MIKEHTIMSEEKGETQEHIDICLTCKVPAKKCNGECKKFIEQAKDLKKKKRLKKNVILY